MSVSLKNENGFIIYRRQSTDQYWEHLRRTKEERLNRIYSALPALDTKRYEEIGEYLIALGQAERDKEENLLMQAFGLTDKSKLKTTEAEFIENFNSILIGTKAYKQALDQIQLAIKSYKETGKSQLAPTISSLFLPKFQSVLGARMNKFIHNHEKELLEGDASDWEEVVENEIQGAIDDTMKKLLTETNKKKVQDIFGTYVEHTDLFEQYSNQTNNYFRGMLKEILYSHIDFSKIKNIMRDNLTEIQNKFAKGKHMTGSTWAGRALSIRSRTGQIGGSVNEFINALKQSVNIEGVNITSRGARVLLHERQKIDNGLILSVSSDFKFDAEKLLEDMDIYVGTPKNLEEAAKKISEYYTQHLSLIDDTFVIFTSGKAYGLNKYSTKGFQNDSHRSIMALESILPMLPEMNVQKASEFIEVVLNTMTGAVLSGKSTEMREYLKGYIFESMAYLMFDDWVALGNQDVGKNAIHVLTLNDVNIPMSVLLMGAGKAIKDAASTKGAKNWFNITSHIPKKIEYQDVSSYPTTQSGQPNASVAWIKQRDIARDASFTTHFLSNFYDIILSYINKEKI